MALFTLVLDYRGGTYIHQVSSDDPDAAMRAWADSTPLDNIRSLSEASRVSVRDALLLGSPQEIDGLRNVWCVSAIIADHLALFHLIKTVP